MAIPEGRVGNKNLAAIAANHHYQMATIIPVGWEAYNHRLPLICNRNNLVKREVMPPGRLETKICNGSRYANFI